MKYELEGQRYDPIPKEGLSEKLPVRNFISQNVFFSTTWANVIDGYKIVSCEGDETIKLVVQFEVFGILAPAASDSVVRFFNQPKERIETVLVRSENNLQRIDITTLPMISKETAEKKLKNILPTLGKSERKIVNSALAQIQNLPKAASQKK
ncbi:hypothetical protein [Leptospira weilii]|nr:hypothetical protein [Leptospira weilii]